MERTKHDDVLRICHPEAPSRTCAYKSRIIEFSICRIWRRSDGIRLVVRLPDVLACSQDDGFEGANRLGLHETHVVFLCVDKVVLVKYVMFSYKVTRSSSHVSEILVAILQAGQWARIRLLSDM
jgi:hypothetical protein